MEFGQRFVFFWTLIVSCVVVFTNGDRIRSPGDIRQGYGLLEAPAELDKNTEERPGRYKVNNIIVQPVQEADSKVANQETDSSLAARPAKHEDLKSEQSKSNIANGFVASNRDTKVSDPQVGPPKNPDEKKSDTEDFKSKMSPEKLAVQPAGQRKPKHVSPQSIPLQNVVVQPIYQKSDPRLGNPRSDPSSNVGIQTGSNFAVPSSYQIRYTGGNLQSTPMQKTRPRYGFYITRTEPNPPNHDAVNSDRVDDSQTDYRPLEPSHMATYQSGWDQDSYYSNLRSNFPWRNIAGQQQPPQYEQNAWPGIPVQAPHIQPLYVHNYNLASAEIDRLNPLGNVPVQTVYEASSAFSHPGDEPTRIIAVQPGYGQDSGILKVNPPVNFQVQPKYQPSSPAEIARADPPNSPPGQSANPQPNEPNPRPRLPPGYPTIKISFLRGYESPELRTEQSQSIPSGAAVQPATILPSQPATNPVVQPTQETTYPEEGIPQPDPPNESGSPFVPSQEVPNSFPVQFIENPQLWEGAPRLVVSSQGYVPIHSELRAQIPPNPAVQPTRGNPVAPEEFGEGFVPYQQAPTYFPSEFLETFDYRQASPLVASSPQYAPINNQLPARYSTNPAVQPTRGNVNAREAIPQPVAPIEFGEGFVPYQQTPLLFPTELLETRDYQQSGPLVENSRGYVPIGREIPTDQRSITSQRVTQAARNIAFRSGHAKPILKVIAAKTNPPREVLVQSGYGQLHCHLKFVPRDNFALSVPKNSTLESEIRRNKNLHQLVVSQLNSMHKQPHVPNPQETLGLFPSRTSGQSPLREKGSKKKKNGWRTSPLFLRSSNPPQCTGRNQFPRSLDSESGPNGGHGQPLRNYPETSSPGLKNISQAVNSIIPKVNATRNLFLDSTLNGIQPRQEQGNSTNSITGITTGIVDATRTLEKKVSDVTSPILGSQINGDPQKNPNNSQSPQASNSNASQNGYQGAYAQGFAPVPTMNNPNDVAKFVNEYRPNVMDAIPSSLNSAVDNSNAYLNDFYENLKDYIHKRSLKIQNN